MRREVDWPRHMISKRLASGATAFYWEAPNKDVALGFTLRPEALGTVYSAARDRALILNAHLTAWRTGRADAGKSINETARAGTIDWWIETYQRSKRFKKLSPRSQSDYVKALGRLADLETKLQDAETGRPRRVGELPLSSLSAEAVDKLYDKLRGPDESITRQANYTADVARVAWKTVARLHPGLFLIPVQTHKGVDMLPINPWIGLTRVTSTDTAKPATRAEAYALADALDKMGHPALAVAALAAFEWHQRPINILAGHLAWTHWRPARRPDAVEVDHHKTGERVWLPLEAYDPDAGAMKMFFPELEARIRALPRLGIPMVMFRPQRGTVKTPRCYSEPYAQHLVQRARTKAKLPTHVTLEACRHGGMTELGDSELTENQVMAVSGHKTPQAARLYVKRTEKQRLAAVRHRRAFVEQTRVKIPNGGN